MNDEQRRARLAMNEPVQAANFSIDVMVVNDEGFVTKKLPEFASSITRWAFVPEAEPLPEENYEFDDTVDDADDSTPEDDGLDGIPGDVEDLKADPPDEQYRILILEHRISAAAFKELYTHVYGTGDDPLIAVAITYFVNVDGVRHAVFRHVFTGRCYTPDSIGASRSMRGPLLVRTHMDPLGVRTFASDGVDEQIKAIIDEHAATSEEVH